MRDVTAYCTEPYGEVMPNIMAVIKGDVIKIKCISISTVSWLNNGKAIKYATILGNTIYVTAELKHHGHFVCTGLLPNETIFQAKAKVIVGGKSEQVTGSKRSAHNGLLPLW